MYEKDREGQKRVSNERVREIGRTGWIGRRDKEIKSKKRRRKNYGKGRNAGINDRMKTKNERSKKEMVGETGGRRGENRTGEEKRGKGRGENHKKELVREILERNCDVANKRTGK